MEIINKYYDELNKLLRGNGEKLADIFVKRAQHKHLLEKYNNTLNENDKIFFDNHMTEIEDEFNKINNDIDNLKDLINDLEEFFNIEHDEDRMKAIFHGDINDEEEEDDEDGRK